jgi:hypothetical protein
MRSILQPTDEPLRRPIKTVQMLGAEERRGNDADRPFSSAEFNL